MEENVGNTILAFLEWIAPGLCLALAFLVPFAIKHAVKAYAEKAVGSVFDKKLEKYKAELSRAAMAKEVLLEREMAFYDKADAQIAELVPLIQDLRDGLVNPPFTDAKANYLTRVLELVVEMKNLSLRYEAYVEPGICGAFKELVIELQSQGGRWHDLAKIISAEADTTDGEKADAGRMCDTVLFLVALVRMRQANYLKLISGEKVIGIEDPDQGTP